jgi:cytochrome d ubiquinol oxidase subunit II
VITLVTFFLGASLVLYAVFGGADFGAAFHELLAPRGRRHDVESLVTRAIGPVWEANHVWLIVAVVILFNGFPEAFRHVALAYHVPLTAFLIVIVLRGTAFTFRHYDAIKDGSQAVYTRLFQVSSLAAPLCLGLIVGGVLLGRPIDQGDYVARFVTPWLSWFGLAIGAFLLALWVFLAAAFLVGEADDPALQAVFRRRARQSTAAAMVLGALVFPAAHVSGLDLLGLFWDRPLALGAMATATALLWPLHWVLSRGGATRYGTVVLRVLASMVFGAVLVGWFALQFPYLIPGPGGGLTLDAAAAPEATLFWLGAALVAGSLLIFPALGYLLWVFKRAA